MQERIYSSKSDVWSFGITVSWLVYPCLDRADHLSHLDSTKSSILAGREHSDAQALISMEFFTEPFHITASTTATGFTLLNEFVGCKRDSTKCAAAFGNILGMGDFLRRI